VAPLRLLQGWGAWCLLGWLALRLPGQAWRAPQPAAFPLGMALVWVGAVTLLVGGALGVVKWRGPGLARSRVLSLWEAPPELLWGGLLLALWPPHWGPPGRAAWILAFLLMTLPGELRWLAQALPPERPLPEAYGLAVQRRTRSLALRTLLGPWLSARWPVWMLGTLVLERILGCRGLGSDWAERVAHRDRSGMLAWLGVLALLWTLGQFQRRRCA
jgi:hypothetical protein